MTQQTKVRDRRLLYNSNYLLSSKKLEFALKRGTGNGKFSKFVKLDLKLDVRAIKPKQCFSNCETVQRMCAILRQCLDSFPEGHPARYFYMELGQNEDDHTKEHVRFHSNSYLHPEVLDKLEKIFDCHFRIYFRFRSLYAKELTPVSEFVELVQMATDFDETFALKDERFFIGETTVTTLMSDDYSFLDELNPKADYLFSGELIMIDLVATDIPGLCNSRILRETYLSGSLTWRLCPENSVQLVSQSGYSVSCVIDSLKAESPYFAALLNDRWSGNAVRTLKIDGISDAGLDNLVEYLHCSRVSNPRVNFRLTVELLIVSNQYFVLGLEEKLLNLLIFYGICDDEDVCSLFTLCMFLDFTGISWEVHSRVLEILKSKAKEIMFYGEFDPFQEFPHIAYELGQCMGLQCFMIEKNPRGSKKLLPIF